jgi:hypothetical protein
MPKKRSIQFYLNQTDSKSAAKVRKISDTITMGFKQGVCLVRKYWVLFDYKIVLII